MKLDLHCEVWVKDRKGRFQSYWNFEAKSYVQQMAELMRVAMGQIATLILPVTGGPAINQVATTTLFDIAAAAGGGVNVYGIVIGTGSAAVLIGNVMLGALITDGVGAGLMNYGGTSISAMETAGGVTRRFRVTRSFINDSGASITVNETGLYSNQGYMMSRELVAGGAVVANNSVLTVRYTIGVTV